MLTPQRLIGTGDAGGRENLDRPVNNYDVAGIPRGQWSSGLFSCLSNILPSCLFSFCCTPILWSQV